MTKRKKQEEQSLPPDLTERKLEAEVKLLELKIESTRLQNLSKQLDLDERSNALCYCTQAVKEFSRGVQAIMTAIKGLPDVLQERCSLTPDQYKEVAGAADGVQAAEEDRSGVSRTPSTCIRPHGKELCKCRTT